ncbi:hypothetical protein [Dactylosporangium sp. NPDC051541]|uniref:hypothetical protein n=1 Tax=Dactylosporangium sp. NPDC051541 TaxID=3363977 RepID=UPI0037BA6DD3
MVHRIEASLSAVDWSTVEGGRPGNHTGPMGEVPQMVAGLWHSDPGRRWDAVDFIETAGFEHGLNRPATVSLAPIVAAAVNDQRSADAWVFTTSDPRMPLRARLLAMLGQAATGAAWGGTDAQLRAKAEAVAAGGEKLSVADYVAGEEAPQRLGVRAMAGGLLLDVLPWLPDSDARVAHAAVFATTRIAQLLPPQQRRGADEQLLAVAEQRDSPGSVAGAAAYALAELGADTTTLLQDRPLVVRACAALSPSTDGDPHAVRALEEAMRYTPANDSWLRPGSALERVRLHMRFAATAAARASSFDQLVPGALAVAAPEGGSTEAGWGPLLRLAFPPGWPDRPLANSQRTFLQVLVGNDSVWGDRADRAMPLLAEVGLPQDREACRTVTR